MPPHCGARSCLHPILFGLPNDLHRHVFRWDMQFILIQRVWPDIVHHQAKAQRDEKADYQQGARRMGIVTLTSGGAKPPRLSDRR